MITEYSMQNNDFVYNIESPFQPEVIDVTKTTEDFMPWADTAKAEEFQAILERLGPALAGYKENRVAFDEAATEVRALCRQKRIIQNGKPMAWAKFVKIAITSVGGPTLRSVDMRIKAYVEAKSISLGGKTSKERAVERKARKLAEMKANAEAPIVARGWRIVDGSIHVDIYYPRLDREIPLVYKITKA